MSGLLDLPTAHENVGATQQVVPADARDFSRPKEPFIAQSLPVDSSMANDGQNMGDPFIAEVQKFMKAHGYTGPEDGISNPELLSSLRNFESITQSRTGKPVIGTIVVGGKINLKGFQDATITKSPGKDNVILSFQKFLSANQPVIGAPYKGPIDGVINNDLINAAKSVEGLIAKAINNNAAHGILWNENSKNFNTTTADLQQSLNLIATHYADLSSKNDANSPRKQALLQFQKKV